MSRADEHRRDLTRLADWEPYLREHSRLLGPRANLELVQVVADLRALDRWIDSDDPDVRWVMRQNLAKTRINRLGADWVTDRRARLEEKGALRS